jgi:hypothetical protein
LSFIQLMKDRFLLFQWRFVFHPAYEGQVLAFPMAFCPSSSLCRTGSCFSDGVLSFIQLMKDRFLLFRWRFVLHPAYEGQVLAFSIAFCPSSSLCRTGSCFFNSVLSFIQLMKDRFLLFQ